MLHSADDSRLTPEQRRHEVAAILARGVLRQRQIAAAGREPGPSDPPQKALEVSAKGRPHGTRG